MAADLARRLDGFDLGLDLRNPEDGTNDGVACTDPCYPVWCLDWGITGVHLSASVMCVTVQPRRLSSLMEPQARQAGKDELRTLLRFAAQLAAEYGLLRPVAGMVLVDACASGSGNDWIHDVRAWAGDQDWHRGEFLLFVETDLQEYRRRCLDLLAPAPDEWSRIEPPKPRQASDVLAAAQKKAGTRELQELFDTMEAAVESTDGGRGRENPLVRRFSRWLNEKLDEIDPRLHWDGPERRARDEGRSGEGYGRVIPHPGTIARIEKLRIKDFRGFGSQQGEPFELDLDADLVLLAGPNGLGKTSLIEALDLMLTGHHHFRDELHHLFHFDAETFELAGTVRIASAAPAAEPRPVTVTCAGRRERDGGGWKQPEIEWSVDDETGSVVVRPLAQAFQQMFGEDSLSVGTARRAEELSSRRTALYPDRLDKLFDETTTGATLRDYLDPLHPVVEELIKAAKKAQGHLSDWRRKIEQEANEPDLKAPRQAVNAALERLRPHHEVLAEPYGGQPEPDGWPSFPSSGDERDLSDFVKALLARSGESAPDVDLPDRLPGIVETLRRDEFRRSGEAATGETAGETVEKIEADIKECEARLKEIDRRFPRVDDDVKAFDADEGQPDLTAILEALRDHAPSWRAAAEARPSLAMLAMELRRIRPEDAAKCAAELRGYLDPRRQALQERGRLRTELAALWVALRSARRAGRAGKLLAMRGPLQDVASELRDAWKKARAADEQRKLARQAQRKLDALDALAADVDRVVAGIDAARASEPLRKKVESLANGVLSRLAPLGGPLRLTLQNVEDERGVAGGSSRRRRFASTTEDGRPRNVLSFGQRTQVGVAMVIAENRLLEPRLGHRVFLMDDLSATYDLANLSRDAIFWRQMAYGDGEAAEASTRQVVLSSHHEDLSNRLLDVMPPVGGRRMLLYRFTGWGRKTGGPTFRVYSVESQPTLNTGQERQDLREWLQAQLEETADAGT